MRIKKRVLMALTLALVMLATPYAMHTSAHAQRRKQVRVYFWTDRDSTSSNPLGVSAVTRRVNAVAPARGALEELLDGPTAQEERRGYRSLNVKEFAIGSLTIRNGTARVNFVASRAWPGWAGDMSPGRFREAVTRTLKQFPTVRRVVVSVNGNPNFDSERG